MKKFICRLLIFLIPFYFVGIFIGFFYYIGWTVGELADFDRMIEAQRSFLYNSSIGNSKKEG